MDVKFLRFLKLSSEFCKEPEGYNVASNYIQGTSITLSGYPTANSLVIDAPSKLEQFKSQKQAEIEKAERWEEFLELKKDLKQYLESKIKLTK